MTIFIVFLFLPTVQQRWLLDRAGPTIGSDHGGKADDQQCPGDCHSQAQGVVAQQEVPPERHWRKPDGNGLQVCFVPVLGNPGISRKFPGTKKLTGFPGNFPSILWIF